MKRIFQHPPEQPGAKKYWRSFEQLAETPEFAAQLEREFPAGAAEFQGGEVSRRHFLKIMGASTALAGVGLSGCRRPEMHLVPFTRSQEWTIPGKFLFYATSMPARRGHMPLIATTFDGRPTKLEGNPLHPINNGHGGTDSFSQASILDLYDPDRSRFFLEKGKISGAKEFEQFLDKLIADNAAGQGDGIAFLLEEDASPTRERLRAEIEKRMPLVRWCVYEPLGVENAAQAATIGFGAGVQVSHALENADVILALDHDFLGCEEGSIAATKAFSARRRADNPDSKMNRLYVVENRFTITGGMADHRLRIPASQIGAFALALAEQISGGTNDASLKSFYTSLGQPQSTAKFPKGWVEELAADLVSARGRSAVLVGSRQPVAVQLVVNAINSALGNLGKTVLGQPTFTKPGIGIAELARDISDKKVSTIVIIGGNPVYNAPADLEWAKAQKLVPNVIRVALHEDETSQLASWHVPRAHYLEAWGDGRSSDGTYVSVQPMIMPLYDGWSDLDVLAKFAGMPKPTGPELIQETFKQAASGGDFNTAWNKFLHDGFLADSAAGQRILFFNSASATGFISENANTSATVDDNNLEVVFIPDSHVDDGRYNNNGWLQETADSVTQLTWDNAAYISPATAKKLGVRNYESAADLIEISLDGNRKLQAPAMIAPGHADNSISLPLGYGRTVTGRIGQGTGFNAYPLRTSTAPYFVTGAKVQKVAGTGELAWTQQHWSMEGRSIVREGTLETFQKNPEFVRTMGGDEEIPKGGQPSLYSHPPMTGVHQWGMTIDLNTCSGCNACVVACQAENNIPVVGKEQVINGREMHWIRMDRYFASDTAYNESQGEAPSDPEMVMMPMLCQHCENAPCETVCPVNATVHSDEGLNVMTYNRCIGTRYCANNCPYKVRRFNFFDYHQRPITPVKVPLLGEVSGLKLGPLTEKGSPETLKMQKNPNVTVRMRGVMEKCTFCVQRIQEAKIAAKVRAGASSDVRVAADAFQVACQQACASESIVFGDIANPESKVAKLKKNNRGYRLLEYLNTNSRITYLAKLRNVNPKMPGAEKIATFSLPESGHEHGENGLVPVQPGQEKENEKNSATEPAHTR